MQYLSFKAYLKFGRRSPGFLKPVGHGSLLSWATDQLQKLVRLFNTLSSSIKKYVSSEGLSKMLKCSTFRRFAVGYFSIKKKKTEPILYLFFCHKNLSL